MSTVDLYITVSDIELRQDATYPDALQLIEQFQKQAPLELEKLQTTLQMNVLAGTNTDIIQSLINNGADVNYTYTGGDKLLRMAYKDPIIADFLLKNGAILTSSEQDFFRDIDPDFANTPIFKSASKNASTDHNPARNPRTPNR
jgi:hypothetical protein